MAKEHDDASEEVALPVSAADLKNLHTSIEEAVNLEVAVEQMEADLKAAKASLEVLRSAKIPELMASVLQSDDTTWNGWRIKIEEIVRGSLPKDPDKRDRAIDWLVENEAGGLIQTGVALSFGRSEHNAALALAASLREQGYEPQVETGVHASTLAAFARERLKDGKEIDPDLLGLYVGKQAKIKRVKEK